MSQLQRDVPKKIHSKQIKSIKYITNDTKISIGVKPTKNIVVCNSGLALGLSQEDVITTFSSYGTVENVVMLPNKTYCFVTFADPSCAQKSYFHIHGKGTLPNRDSLLVLAFAECVPSAAPLWPSNRDIPPGLIVLEGFVSFEEESKLVSCIRWEDSSGSILKHRQVQHFGFKFRYGSNDIDINSPLKEHIPKECDFLPTRLARSGCERFCPDQLTVNHYLPGQGIPPHVDTHSVFDDPIVSLSLLSDVVMDFRDASGKKVPVLVPRCSLLIMSGESRYGWTHGITPRSNDIIQSKETGGLTVLPRSERLSFTFRKIRKDQKCFCDFPLFCDTQKIDLLKEQCVAADLEKTYVQEVYEEISNHFSATRYKAWPNVLEFCKSFKTGDILVDVGCGNGKYFGHHSKYSVYEVGLDMSLGLASVCAERGFEVLNGNCISLPFQPGVADGCLCIAVIHHLSTHERRCRAVQEISRILCKGGRALIYVWARDQRSSNVQSCYLKDSREESYVPSFAVLNEKQSLKNSGELNSENFSVNSNNENSEAGVSGYNTSDDGRHFPLPVHCNRTNFQHSDVLVPWKLREKFIENNDKKEVYYRYYHMFEKGELEQLCSEVPEIQIVDSRFDEGNWVVVLLKPQ